MGIFIVLTGQDMNARAKTLKTHYTTAGFEPFKDIKHRNFRFLQYRKLNKSPANFHVFDNDDFITHTGSFLYKDRCGDEAIKDYFSSFDGSRVSWRDARGHFALIVQRDDTLFVSNDALDAYAIYRNKDGTVYSNSFLAVLECQPRRTINVQGCYEFAWNESVFGGKTFINEIERVPANTLVRFGERTTELAQSPPITIGAATNYGASFEDTVTEHSGRLRSLFSTYAANFGDRIRTALSGGYDSRLILALLLDAGVDPDIFVFGNDDDPDAQVALTIAKGENLHIEHIDKSRFVIPPPDAFAENVEKDFAAFDGWKFSGIFDNGSDLHDRLHRSESDKVVMNGSVGEIYRNFYYLPDRPHTYKDVARAFYARYSPSACTDEFSARAFETGLVEAMRTALRIDGDRLNRNQVEALYPLFRGRYWTSRDVAINQRFGWTLFPFLEGSIIQDTSEIPLGFKNNGRFEAAIINTIHPKLAAYPSVYRHGFHEPPSASHRISTMTSMHRPIWLRRNMYRLRTRRPESRPFYLSDAYLKHSFDLQFPYMGKYFHLENVFSSNVYNRIATMEFLFQKYNVLENKLGYVVNDIAPADRTDASASATVTHAATTTPSPVFFNHEDAFPGNADLSGDVIHCESIKRPILIMAVDTEEEFDWSQGFDKESTGVTHFEMIHLLQNIFTEYNIKPEYIVDYPVVTQEFAISKLLQYYHDGKANLGVHLQAWVNPPFDEETTAFNSYANNLGPELERRKLLCIQEAFQEAVGVPATVYKAGRYGIGASTQVLLEAEGFEVDLSSGTGFDLRSSGGPDFSHANPNPYWFGSDRKLLGIPTTGGFVGPLSRFGAEINGDISQYPLSKQLAYRLLSAGGLSQRIRLSPEGFSLSDLKGLTQSLLNDDVRVFSLSLHSPSVKPGCTPYVRTLADREAMFNEIRGYFDFFFGDLNGVTMTPLELKKYLEDRPSDKAS